MGANENSKLKSLISLPVGTKILLKSTVPTSIFEVLRDGRVEVLSRNLESNAEEHLKKEMLFDLYFAGNATFIYPNQSWEKSVDELKRSVAETMRGLSEAQRNAVRLKHELCKEVDKGANSKGHVPRSYVLKISEAARKAHPTVKGLARSSLYTLYKMWRASGGHIASLFPAARQGNTAHRFHKDVIELFNRYMKDHYLRREAPEQQEVYDAFRTEIKTINESRSPEFQLKTPSLDTFRRWIQKLDRYEVALARHGEAVARKCAGYSASLRKATRPLEIVEVDHTPIDYNLLSELTGIPCGRAWLTIMVDVYSRMIIGWDISFDPPSYLSVARALEHAIKPKPAYPGAKYDHPAYGKPELILVDNGPEFHSKDLEDNCAALHITIEYTPRRKPWRKPHVERLFREINRLFHSMPASTFSNYIKKGDFNPDRSTYAMIEDVKDVVARWIVDVYHQRPHGGINGVNAIPYHRFLAGIEKYPVNLPRNIGELAVALGKSDERILHEYGIEFRGVYFKSPEVQTIRSHPTYRPKQKVEIRYLESDCTKIHVKHPDGHYIEFQNEYARGSEASEGLEGYSGLNFFQMQLVRKHAQETLNRKSDWAGIAAARDDIRRRLGFYDRKRKRRYTREETRMAHGFGRGGGVAADDQTAPNQPKPRRAARTQSPDPMAHRTDTTAWGSRIKNIRKD